MFIINGILMALATIVLFLGISIDSVWLSGLSLMTIGLCLNDFVEYAQGKSIFNE